MTDDVSDIRKRLEAVADIDWTNVKHVSEEEYYSDWVHIGPVMMNAVGDPEEIPSGAERYWSQERIADVRAEQRADKRREEAIVDFLTHAADDIRRLLDAAQDRRSTT